MYGVVLVTSDIIPTDDPLKLSIGSGGTIIRSNSLIIINTNYGVTS